MKLSEMFPARFLRGQDLTAPILVVITGIERDEVHPRPGVTETKYILRFHRIDPRSNKSTPLPNVATTATGHGAILRHTLAEQIAGILKTEETDEWIGQRIVLEPTKARAAGRDVITISARAPKQQPKPALKDPTALVTLKDLTADPAPPASQADTNTQEATK